MTQGTITAAFDKCKRKLTPNKEADTARDNLKFLVVMPHPYSNHMDASGSIIVAYPGTP